MNPFAYRTLLGSLSVTAAPKSSTTGNIINNNNRQHSGKPATAPAVTTTAPNKHLAGDNSKKKIYTKAEEMQSWQVRLPEHDHTASL
jgi:hypothetical protein